MTRLVVLVSLFALAAQPALVRPVFAQGGAGQPATGQTPVPPVLTLDDAIRLSLERSEQVAAAQADVDRARAGQRLAQSERFPQVYASASYDRTLASEFKGLFSGGSSASSCDPFTLRPETPLADRVAEIERAIDCGAVGNAFSGSSFKDLPFGRENTYRVGLSVAQSLYTGGRISAQRRLAEIEREAAGLAVDSARAQAILDVTQAFYDAALSDRMVEIAEATLFQAESTLARVTLGREAGRQPEFDRLRAQVDRDNQRPAVIRARSQRTLAYLRLRQILELPADQPLTVAANLDDAALPPPAWFAAKLEAVPPELHPASIDARTPIRQMAASVQASEQAVRIAASERKPTVSANSLWSRVGYPSNLWPGADYRTNWTVGVSVQVPLFTGGRLGASRAAAQADLARTESRLKLAREYAWLDGQAALEAVESARAAWEASAGTVQQADRAYEIAELRYREGISTQVELSDARLLLQQAQANRAVAARDYQVARARLALLPDLPLASPASSSTAGASAGGPATGMTLSGSASSR
jgi:outer membrane protein TolC